MIKVLVLLLVGFVDSISTTLNCDIISSHYQLGTEFSSMSDKDEQNSQIILVYYTKVIFLKKKYIIWYDDDEFLRTIYIELKK